MANFSDLSRKQQVHAYLKTRLNAWVDGPDIANEQVGGSEGLKRLRELRVDLKGTSFEIEMRAHPEPDRDIFQYRLTQRLAPKAEWPGRPINAQVDARVFRPPPPPPVQSRPDKGRGRVVYDPETETYVAVYDGPLPEPEPQLPGQTDLGVPEADLHKFTSKPPVGFGTTIICPRCKGIHRALKEQDPVTGKAMKRGKVLGYEEMTRDPAHPSKECIRCDGWGLIPPT